MEKGNYNGWSNRSTWLVNLHMGNTSKEIHELYESAGKTAKDVEQFKARVIGYLMPHTTLKDEDEWYMDEINWKELLDVVKTD